jgi:ATP-binding cassette subfamily B protein
MKNGRIESEGTLSELLAASTEMQLLWQGIESRTGKEAEQFI